MPSWLRAQAWPLPVAQVAGQLQRPGQAGGGGRVVPGQLLHDAQLGEDAGLALRVADRARSGQGGLAESDSLVPVALGVQEAAHRNGNPDGVHKMPVGCGVAGTGVQVGAFGSQPGDRLFLRAQFRGPGRRRARRRRAGDGGAPGDVPAGGHGGVQVVVQQPADRGLLIRGAVAGGASPGVFAEQVVQAVPAAGRLADQVLVIQLAEAPPGGLQVGAVQGRGGVGVDVGAGVQAEPAEQALLADGQILVGQVERRRHRDVFGLHGRQPVTGRGQVSSQVGDRPGGMMAQSGRHQPDRQRQIAAQPGHLGDRGICRAAGRGGRPGGRTGPRPRRAAACRG